MKTLKRPMFRKGGNVGNGIMTGIRDNFEVGGSAAEKLKAIAESYKQPGFDPLTQFLIQGGLKLASAPATGGGVIADIATAAQDPAAQLMENVAAQEKFKRDIALQGAALDLEEERDLRKLKQEQDFKEKQLEREIQARKDLVKLEQGGDNIFKTEDFFEEYGSKVQAENRKNYENNNLETKANEAFGQSYEGFIGGKHGRLKDFEKKNNIGKVYYDVTDGNFKRLRKTPDGYSYETIDIATFDPEADKAAKVPAPKFTGEKSKTPGYRRPPKDFDFSIFQKDPFDIDDPSA